MKISLLLSNHYFVKVRISEVKTKVALLVELDIMKELKIVLDLSDNQIFIMHGRYDVMVKNLEAYFCVG